MEVINPPTVMSYSRGILLLSAMHCCICYSKYYYRKIASARGD